MSDTVITQILMNVFIILKITCGEHVSEVGVRASVEGSSEEQFLSLNYFAPPWILHIHIGPFIGMSTLYTFVYIICSSVGIALGIIFKNIKNVWRT